MRRCRQGQPKDADINHVLGQGLQLASAHDSRQKAAHMAAGTASGCAGVRRMQELQQHLTLSEDHCMDCCRHKQVADAGVRRAQELQQQLVAAQHQVQLQCSQLAQLEAQVTAERQRVRAAQAEQLKHLSGKPSCGPGCISVYAVQQGCGTLHHISDATSGSATVHST